jgi:two-component system phosphate regulon sensor histidine kinase PhoR
MAFLSQVLSIVIEFQVFWLIFLGLAATILLALGASLGLEVRKQIKYVRLLQKQRLTAQENYRQAIYLLSHEFSTPLQTMLTCLSNLSNAPRPSPEWDRNHSLAVEEARRLGKMVTDMRLLAHLETKGAITLQPVNMGAVIKSALMKYGDWAEAAGADIQYEGPERLPSVLGDRAQLTHVMENLIDNALKYRRPDVPPKIIVNATVNNDRLYIRVSDNGRGIAAEDVPHIFNPTFRSPEASISKSKGSGLGLAIIKHIIEQHKGEITVRSQVGEYTVFSFWLPRYTS